MDDKKNLSNYYTENRRIHIDSKEHCIKVFTGTFCVGDKVRYTDDFIDIANQSKPNNNKIAPDAYKAVWQQKILIIVGFDMDDNYIVLLGYTDELTKKFTTFISNLTHLQLVTESEEILYGV